MRKLLRGRRRAWLALPVVLLVAAATSGAWLLTRDSSEAAASTTATVSTQTMQQTVSADGTLAARRTRDESFAVSGTVTRVAVSEGDRVQKGDVLATVGSAALVAARTAAAASLDAAIAQLDDDEDSGASDVQVTADEASIVSARANLSDARQAVDDATLRATIPGTVTSVGVSKGDTVGSSTGATGATDTTSTADVTIVSTNEYDVAATVAAADVDQLKKGMQAQVTATGVDDTIYGTVKTVGLVAQTNDSGAAVFPVTIEVTGKQNGLFAGVSATATIIVKETPDVLTVVSRALSTEDDKTYVTKVVDGKEVKTEVTIGKTYGMTTEVTSGLKDGDTVVIPGFTAPTGGTGTTNENGFPGGGQMPDFSQMGGTGMPAGGPPQ